MMKIAAAAAAAAVVAVVAVVVVVVVVVLGVGISIYFVYAISMCLLATGQLLLTPHGSPVNISLLCNLVIRHH